MLLPRKKKSYRFTMMLSTDDLKKLQKLAQLAGEGVSATVRAAINREYHTKIVMKRQ
jgi:hypothetical protein